MTEPALACVAPTSSSEATNLFSSSPLVSRYEPDPYTGATPQYLLPESPLFTPAEPELSCSIESSSEPVSTPVATPAPRPPARSRRPAAPTPEPASSTPSDDALSAQTATAGGDTASPAAARRSARDAPQSGTSIDLEALDADDLDDPAAQQRNSTRLALTVPPRRARAGHVPLAREPLYFAATPAAFAARRALAVKSRPAADAATQKAAHPQATDPDLPRTAYAEAAADAQSLYARLVAAAADIAREAQAQNAALAEQHRTGLGRALAGLRDGLDRGVLQLGTRRDFALNVIRSQSDMLRSNILRAAQGALGRLTTIHRFYVTSFDPVKAQRGNIVARISTGFATVTADGFAAHDAMDRIRRDPQDHVRFAASDAMKAAQYEALDLHIAEYIQEDDDAIGRRMLDIEKHLKPLMDCLPCEIDRNLQQLDLQERNVAILGPQAVRAARDGALRSVSETQRQLELSLAEAHRETETGLVAQHDATRAALIGQAETVGRLELTDIKAGVRRNMDVLSGMAGAQSTALASVHGELVKASDRPLAQFAPAAVQASRRLRANLQATGERNPATVLALQRRQSGARPARVEFADRTRSDTVDDFARDLIALVNTGFDRLALTNTGMFLSMEGMPGSVARVADGFVGPATAAVQTDIDQLAAFMTQAQRRVNDALNGTSTPPAATPEGSANPGAERNMCSIDDTASYDPSAGGPNASVAPPRERPTPRGGGSAAPPTCSTCVLTPPAADVGSRSEAPNTSGVSTPANPFLSSAGEPNMSMMPLAAAPEAAAPSAADVAAAGQHRSAAAFHRETGNIARDPATAPAVAGYVGRITANIPDRLRTRCREASAAMSEIGQPNMPTLFSALHNLTALQGAAMKEMYRQNHEKDLETHLRERIMQSGVSYDETRAENMRSALALLNGDQTEGAISELRASFAFRNETGRINERMARLSTAQMRELVATHGKEMRERAEHLDETDRAAFLAMMDCNPVRARSVRLKAGLDEITDGLREGRAGTTASRVHARGDETARVFTATETAAANAMEGDPALAREDSFGLRADDGGDARRRTERWQAIQRDFGTLPGVIEAVAYASPDRAMSRPTDSASTALIDYATRPVSVGPYRYTAADAARRRERATSGTAPGNDHYLTALNAIDQGVTPQHRLFLENIARHGSDSDEARGAALLVERRRTGGPDRDRITALLHIGSADAQLGGGYRDRSEGEAIAATRRACVFAFAEEYRRDLEGGASGPVDPVAAQAMIRAEFAASLEGDPRRRDVVLGAVDSEHGDIHAVMRDAIAREDTALALVYLRRMDRRQIDAFVGEWNLAHPGEPSLQQRLGLFRHHWSVYNMNGATFSGDTANELEIAFMGVEQNDKERGEVALRHMDQQIEQSGALGRFLAGSEYDALLANAARLREQMGVAPSELDEQGRIRFNDGDFGVNVRVNFDRDGNFVPAPGTDAGAFERAVTLGRISAENYTRAVDRIGTIISTVLIVAAAVISTIATGGAAASIWIPMLITAGAGLVGIGINVALKGGRYGRDDLVRDLVSTAVQTLTAGLGAAAGIASRAGSGGRLMALRAVGSRMRVPDATLARFMVTRGGLRAGLSMGQELRNPAVLGAFSNAATTALDPAARRSGDYGSQVVHSFFRGALGGAANAGATRIVAGGVGRALSNSTSRSAIARALASGKSPQVAARFGRVSAERMGSSLFANAASRSLGGGVGGALSRGVEMSWEANIQGRRYAASDYFDQVSHAFLQNAAQGMLEAGGDRAMRRRYASRETEHVRDQRMRAGQPDPTGFLHADRIADYEAAMAARAAADDPLSVAPAALLEEPVARTTASQAQDEEAAPVRPTVANDEEAKAEIVALAIRADDAEGPGTGRTTVAANDNGPAGSRPVHVRSALADGEILKMGPVPEGSVFLHPDSTNLEAANDNFVRLVNADRNREVAVYHNPETGEYLVIQGEARSVAMIRLDGEIHTGSGGFPAQALARKGGRWLLRHHFHPNREGQAKTNMARVLASGHGGDMSVVAYEANAHDIDFRSSRIYFVHDGELRFTDFGVFVPRGATGEAGEPRFWINFPDPATGERVRRTFDTLDDYQTFFKNQTASDPPLAGGVLRARTDDERLGVATLDPSRRVGGENARLGDTLTDANRADAAFVAQRMTIAGEFEASRRAGRAHASGIDPVLGRQASLNDAHDLVTRMGLVDRPDAMRRLAAVINDPALDVAAKARLLEAVRDATRAAMIADGRLRADEPLVLTLHGATAGGSKSLRTHGLDMAMIKDGSSDDFAAGLYFSTQIENALLYAARKSDTSGPGEIFPAVLRGRDLGSVIDITPGGAHRAAWEAFVRANQFLFGGMIDVMAEAAIGRRILEAQGDSAPRTPIELANIALAEQSRNTPFEQMNRVTGRGTVFDAFAAQLARDAGDPRLARPEFVLGELGGPFTTGVGNGDQQAIRSQRVADIVNEQLGLTRLRIATDDPEAAKVLPPAAQPDQIEGVPWPVPPVRGLEHVDAETHRLVEMGFERTFGPVHRDRRTPADIPEADRAAAAAIVAEQTKALNARIDAIRDSGSPHGTEFAALLAAAPLTIRLLLLAMTPGLARDSTPLLHPDRIAAVRVELALNGVPVAQAEQIVQRLRTLMRPDGPLFAELADAVERIVSPVDVARLNARGEEALARLIDATEIKRIGGLKTLPAGALIGQLWKIDAQAVVTAIRTPGDSEARVAAYVAARNVAGASDAAIATELPALRAALADPKLDPLIAAARAAYAKAAITSEVSLAEMVAASPVLRQLAAIAPDHVAERYAREMQRPLKDRKAPRVLTADRLEEQMIDQYGVHIVRPIISEIASAFHLAGDVGIDVLKANALGIGAANKGDLDIVAVLRPRAGEPAFAPGHLARILLIDDKAESDSKLTAVRAMEGAGLIRNLGQAIDEIETGHRMWAKQGYPPDPMHVAALNQMKQALADLNTLEGNAAIGATRPAKGAFVDRWRRADYVAEVAAIMKRNGITLLITSEYGAINELTSWMLGADFKLIDEYLREMRRAGLLRPR